MNIVYAMTRNVYEWILPSIRSLAERNPEAQVFILAEDDTLPFALPLPAEVINVSGQAYFPENGVNYRNDFTYINLLKVRYPSILPVDKVIHLDIDTIICDSLESLWDTDLTGKWFAACRENNNWWYRPFGDRYFNMGIAVINLEQMRQDGVEQTMQDFLNTVPQPFADQDAWNKYGIEADMIASLDTRWNECDAVGRTDNPAIIHFCGFKDWWTKRDMCRVEYLDRYREDME